MENAMKKYHLLSLKTVGTVGRDSVLPSSPYVAFSTPVSQLVHHYFVFVTLHVPLLDIGLTLVHSITASR